MRIHRRTFLRDRRGVALPLALLGLISVSLLVTTALVTSSTELAISGAYQDATGSLYSSEGALHQYIGHKRASSTGLNPVVDDALVSSHRITVTELYAKVDTASGKVIRELKSYALLAKPGNGRGRMVAATVLAQRSASMLDLTVEAGLTVGGDLRVSGSSIISDGTGALCDSAKAQNAVQVSAGSQIDRSGAAAIIGKADTATYSKTEMVSRLLGGMTLDEAARHANIKFTPGEFNGRVKSYNSSGPRPKTDKYNWGCPAGSTDACTTVSGNSVNITYWPTIAIDAGGGTVTLEGDHGQGVLIIQNGSAAVRGNFVFSGIILVAKDLDVSGSGGVGGVKLEGAVVALGENSTVRDNATGNSVISYNKCIINAAEAGMNLGRLTNAPQTYPLGALGYMEVVR